MTVIYYLLYNTAKEPQSQTETVLQTSYEKTHTKRQYPSPRATKLSEKEKCYSKIIPVTLLSLVAIYKNPKAKKTPKQTKTIPTRQEGGLGKTILLQFISDIHVHSPKDFKTIQLNI